MGAERCEMEQIALVVNSLRMAYFREARSHWRITARKFGRARNLFFVLSFGCIHYCRPLVRVRFKRR